MRSLFAFLRQIGAQVRSLLRALFQRGRIESDMDLELENHLESLIGDLIRAGHSRAEASRRARIALGSVLAHKEGMRASLGLRWWDELGADLRYGVRILRRSPSFTAIAAISLALAIGANTTIFSVAKRVLLDRLSVPHPEELRMLRWNGKELVHGIWGDFDSTQDGVTSSVFSYPLYLQLRAHNDTLQDLIAFKEDGMNATVHGNAQRIDAAMAGIIEALKRNLGARLRG